MSNKMKKAFNIRGMLDGLRQSVGSSSPKSEAEIEETLRSEDLQVCKTVRHGFPYQPTALAYDTVQHLLAIGTKGGSLRIFGQPGVDLHCHHGAEVAVTQILFLINEGALVTSCSDDNLHLWNFRQKRPEIVHSLKFQRERITHCQLSFQSKWLYVGTERGNVHIVNIESFILSGYVINWNKAIELSRKTHPGPVIHLSDNPLDPNKLLIGFESGAIVLWDLRNKVAEFRFQAPEALRSISWHHEGKQFMGSHTDGSLTTWNLKVSKPASIITPHAKLGKEGKPDPCKPITKVEWKSVRNSDPLVIFSGGMSYDRAGRTPCITVMTGKTTTVLEMEHNVVDFVVLCETPWVNDYQDPYAIVVLLQNDLVVIDLTSPGYPCFENPYPMDIHESPVTACQYFADCPTDLIPALYSVGSKQKRTGFSDKRWPIKGGQWGTATCSYPEIIVTGHADGSLKFWDASAVTLQVLYKLKTAKIFEKPKNKTLEGQEDDPFAIYLMFLDEESRLLVLAGATHVMLFKFSKQEVTLEVPSLDVSIVYEVCDDLDSPELDYPKPSLAVVGQHQSGSIGSHSSNTSDSTKPEQTTALKVRQGARKWGPGYQPDLVCLLTWMDNEHPGNITSVSINSSYGLLAFGNESGLAIVDIVQKSCLLNLGTPDLYGSMDPYQRAPRSPRGKKAPQPFDGSNPTLYTNINDEGARSPTSDQSASPEFNTPQVPPRRKHKSNNKLGLIDVDVKTRLDKGPLTAPVKESPFVFTQSKDQSDAKRPELSITPATPQVGRKEAEELRTTNEEDEEDTDSNKIEVPKKPGVVRTASLPLVNMPSSDTVIKEKSQSEENFRTAHSESDQSVDLNLKESENEIKNTQQQQMNVRKYSMKDFKKRMKKKKKKRDKSKERVIRINSDTNGNDLVEVDNVFHDTESRSETDDNVVSEDDIISPSEEKGFHTKHKEGFLRRMSVKMKNLVWNDDSDSDEKKDKKKKDTVVTVNDLTQESVTKKPVLHKMTVKELQVVYLKPEPSASDKNDGSSFSRSRSSSMSSLENVSKEAIQCLVFADSYTRKFDNFTCPCLWVGTSLGSVLVIVMNLPPSGEQRLTQPVIVSPSGTIFRLKGAIQCMSFLDCNGMIIPAITSGAWKEDKQNSQKSQSQSQSQSTPQKIKISPSSSTEIADRQFAIICSEKQARVVSLPSQTCPYKVRISESSFVIKADVINLRGESVCLACYVANGHIMVYSLPSLKLLLDVEFLALTDLRVARTFCFSNHGHAMYMCSPTELQKITYSAEICDNLNEMLGELFLPTETPEAPKQGFFKNLFGGPSTLDREELFGESSGKCSRGLATRVPGSGGIQQLQAQAAGTTSAGGEVMRARQLFTERGEKLAGLSDRTEEMASQAEAFSSTAHQLMLKYKDKKWYQF